MSECLHETYQRSCRLCNESRLAELEDVIASLDRRLQKQFDHEKELEAERDALRDAIKFAHERLEPESDCPLWEHMAESLRQLADESAGWMEVAVEHNVQCEQLNGTKVRYKRRSAELRVAIECALEAIEEDAGSLDIAPISRGVDILRAAREAGDE